MQSGVAGGPAGLLLGRAQRQRECVQAGGELRVHRVMDQPVPRHADWPRNASQTSSTL